MKKEYRIKKNEDFQKIIKKKNYVSNQCFVVYYDKNESHMRVGISVGKKIGKAVIRNKVKRQVRMMINEVFDEEKNIDYIVIVRNKYLQCSYCDNLKELKYLYDKINKRMEK